MSDERKAHLKRLEAFSARSRLRKRRGLLVPLLVSGAVIVVASVATVLAIRTQPDAAPIIAPEPTGVAMQALVITAEPTPESTLPPTLAPTLAPTRAPTSMPTLAPTAVPTPAATAVPTPRPTQPPLLVPTVQPAAVPARLTEVSAVKTKRPVVALTFDAGGDLGASVKTLDALRNGGVRATFFVTGAFAEQYPEVMQRIVRDGHELANHTYSHADLTTMSDQAIRAELARTDELLHEFSGVSSKPLMRMPFGSRDARVTRVVNAAGYRSVFWALDSADWRVGSTPAGVATRVLTYAEPGDIVVEHCAEASTASALPTILEGLRERGYSVVTLSNLLRDE